VRVQSESVTYATITIQNYFRMYEKLAGMSGTALTEAEEFDKIYKLGVLPIPTNLEYEAMRPESGLVELEARDENGYKYHFYARKNDPEKKPVYWRRKDYPDVVYRSEEAKFRAIIQEILRNHSMGRPVLVGTTSVELSERLSSRLRAEPLQRLAQAILLRRVWMEKNNREEDGRQIAELQFLNARLQDLQVADMRKMARDLSISLTPYDPENLGYLREALDLSPEYDERLIASLKAGVPHQVLNARKHDEEGMIIAGAGGFGAVTIATNMAGRGVDIRLGGELPDEVINQVRLLLRREDVAEKLSQSGLSDIDHMSISQWPRALELVGEDELRSRAEAVEQFRNYVEMEERVRQLGGLHVIGSERHEARRIDNQLRGRSARQGDPGSSRFYLSMEDDLMRMFGGQQADGLMQRLKVDDAVPIEAGLVSRIVEQSQTRVEGANFDVRKHLLEYDDVLNSQRAKIYAQRDLIFTKEDLSEDVDEMLRTEVLRRVPEALQDADGPWKLLGWLDSIQPAINFDGNIFPSFSLKLLLDHLLEQRASMTSPESVRAALVRLAADALDAERDHLLHSARALLEGAEERLEEQLKERQETLDTYIEGLDLGDDEESQPRNPKEIVDELSGALHIPVRLNNEQMRLLRSDPEEALEDVRNQMVVFQQEQAIKRLVGAVERRLEDNLELNLTQSLLEDWDALADALFQAVEQALQRRRERLVGDGLPGGQIGKDLETWMARIHDSITVQSLTNLLVMMPQGSRQVFDKKTHRRITQRTNRLTYIYLAARLLEQLEQDTIADDVLEHLQNAHTAILRAWGASVWPHFANANWDSLDAFMQERLGEILDEDKLQILDSNPLQSLDNEDILKVLELLGGRALTQVYRQLLLSVIGELWVEYLTQMEALRVSIGLEAYAQRDPLVQYKGRASELFANLLSNMRLGVVNRMFTFRPRDLPGEQMGLRQEEGLPAGDGEELPEPEASLPEGEESYAAEDEEEAPVQVSQSNNAGNVSRSQKRRRRRK
jgi:preprotein translocase subunit SecA